MSDDPASLDRLHDIVAPGPVPWWPPAPGVYLVLGIFLILVLIFALRALRHHLRQAYRREALAEIRRGRLSVVDLATLLKRVAVTAYPREQVAALTGRAWLDWLRLTGRLDVPPGVADLLTSAVYSGAGNADTAALTVFVRLWIRRHRVPKP
jgi:hypothetical protein